MNARAHPSTEVKAEISKKLQMAIESRYSSVAEAADDLGVSRQRLHRYLRAEAVPHADFLLLAMKRWDLKLNCFGAEFSHADVPAVTPDENQLSLFPEQHARVAQSGRFLLAPRPRMELPVAANRAPRTDAE
jgi:transcriptional regulator with XRE-family HTH domain